MLSLLLVAKDKSGISRKDIVTRCVLTAPLTHKMYILKKNLSYPDQNVMIIMPRSGACQVRSGHRPPSAQSAQILRQMLRASPVADFFSLNKRIMKPVLPYLLSLKCTPISWCPEHQNNEIDLPSTKN